MNRWVRSPHCVAGPSALIGASHAGRSECGQRDTWLVRAGSRCHVPSVDKLKALPSRHACNLGVLAAALDSMGVSRNSIVQYERVFTAEKFLLIVHGERPDIERVRGILHSDFQQLAVHTV